MIRRRRDVDVHVNVQNNNSGSNNLSSIEDVEFAREVINYRIHKKMVGKGAYSTIWEATNAEDNKTYVAKISPKKKSQMVNEHYFNSVGSLYTVSDHPNIIKLHHHTETNQHYYLFIDYHHPPTITLNEFLEFHNHNLPLETSLSIFAQLVSAISYMHRTGVSHRDIKPDNILIHPETLLITIIDFGFASTASLCSDHIGSPLYMSPEMLNEKSYDPKLADIWSLGILFYQLIFGNHPLVGTKSISELTTAYNVESINIPKLYPTWGMQEVKEVDRIVRDILEQLLQKEPEKRFTSDSLEKKVLDKDYVSLCQKVKN